MQKRLLPIALFLLFFLGMALIQFVTPDMPDNDGFYHIKLAWLMRTEGLKPDFPFLPLSILNEGEFYDHHFLFHVALIPFTLGDLRMGAKWAAVTFASLAFLAVWYLFHRQRVPFAWLWALGLLGISEWSRQRSPSGSAHLFRKRGAFMKRASTALCARL